MDIIPSLITKDFEFESLSYENKFDDKKLSP